MSDRNRAAGMGYVLAFDEIDQTHVALVGGKGARLGELARIDGIRVPDGFCVTTDAFRRLMADAPSIDDRLDRLLRLKPDDRTAIGTLSAEIRRVLEGIPIPDDLVAATKGPTAGSIGDSQHDGTTASDCQRFSIGRRFSSSVARSTVSS